MGDMSPRATVWSLNCAPPDIFPVIGADPLPSLAAHSDACALVFSDGADSPPALRVYSDGEWAEAPVRTEPRRLVLVVGRASMLRLGGANLLSGPGAFHLPPALRQLVMALIETNVPTEAMATYRLAKSIEILCEALKLHRDGELLPLLGVGGLSPADTRRVLEARRLIEERCGEKLTLTNIAKSCGLNRTKLTRGFRDLFNCSVAETLMACRLERASHLLRTTDRPVACIGYETGYENNASFARAFGKRYGRTPTDYRTRVLAA